MRCQNHEQHERDGQHHDHRNGINGSIDGCPTASVSRANSPL